MTDIKEWYDSQPMVTKHWLTLVLMVPILSKLNVIPWSWIVTSWPLIFESGQIWRFFTGAFVAKPAFPWLMTIYFIYSYHKRLEDSIFAGKYADHVYFIAISWINCGVSFHCCICCRVCMYNLWCAYILA